MKRRPSRALGRSREQLIGRRGRERNNLKEFLARCPEPGFLVMVWGAERIESGRLSAARRAFHTLSEGLLEQAREKPAFFYKWALETLVNEWLLVSPAKRFPGPNSRVDTRHLGAAAEAIRLMNRFENAEDGLSLRNASVFRQMSRMIQRQAPWQRGIVSKASLYRAARLYIFDEAAAYFQTVRGLSIEDFSRSCFAIYAHLASDPGHRLPIDANPVGIEDDAMNAALRTIALPVAAMRNEAWNLRQRGGHPAYLPSVLRQHPCAITYDGRGPVLVAPLVDLVIERCTTGLFYDLASAGGEVRRRIGENFEKYCCDLVRGFLPSLIVLPAEKYTVGRRAQDTPDIRVHSEHHLEVVIECKARRAAFDDKFPEDDSVIRSEGGVAELVKAVTQIWRFASARRRRAAPSAGPPLSDDAVGLVLTLDTWTEFSSAQRDWVIKQATSVVANDPDMIALDHLPITFCHVEDFEFVLQAAADDDVLRVLKRAADPDRRGYMLSSLLSECCQLPRGGKADPFEDDFAQSLRWFAEWPAMK